MALVVMLKANRQVARRRFSIRFGMCATFSRLIVFTKLSAMPLLWRFIQT